MLEVSRDRVLDDSGDRMFSLSASNSISSVISSCSKGIGVPVRSCRGDSGGEAKMVDEGEGRVVSSGTDGMLSSKFGVI